MDQSFVLFLLSQMDSESLLALITLQNWLFVVSALSLFGSVQAFLSPNTLKERQFSLAPEQGRSFTRSSVLTWTQSLLFAGASLEHGP